jgi:hypothetical protein
VAVESHLGHVRARCPSTAGRAARDAHGLFLHVASAHFHGLPEAHDAGRRSRSRAPAPLVLAAVLDRHHLRALADVEAGNPLGRRSCGAENDIASMPIASTSIGTLPNVCTASTWNGTPCSRAIRPMSVDRWMVPTSLFACITLIAIVSGRMRL